MTRFTVARDIRQGRSFEDRCDALWRVVDGLVGALPLEAGERARLAAVIHCELWENTSSATVNRIIEMKA